MFEYSDEPKITFPASGKGLNEMIFLIVPFTIIFLNTSVR